MISLAVLTCCDSQAYFIEEFFLSFYGFSCCNRFYPHPFPLPHPPICKHGVFEQTSTVHPEDGCNPTLFCRYEKPCHLLETNLPINSCRNGSLTGPIIFSPQFFVNENSTGLFIRFSKRTGWCSRCFTVKPSPP